MNVVEIIKNIAGEQKIEIAMVLGSGLSMLGGLLSDKFVIAYSDLEGFPGYGHEGHEVSGHGSDLLIGNMGGKRVAILTGREHYYEHGNAAAMRPALEVLSSLGAKTLILTNSAGSLDKNISTGDLMLISDHINYAGMNPLIGEVTDKRFVNMVDCYDATLRSKAKEIAGLLDIEMKSGIYLWYSGPSFETVAEIKMAQILGASAVGMSTAPEVIIGRMLGLKIIAISSITNMGAGLSNENISHEHTKKQAKIGAKKLERLIPKLVEKI
jgi:purine-nucleoside phosphorylase